MLSPKDITEFKENGFLIVKDILPKNALAAIDAEISARLDALAKYLGADFGRKAENISEKMLELERHHPGASLIFAHSYIMSPALFKLWSSDLLLDMAESLIGPDIDGHPFWSLRPKPPEVDLFVVPWHQDSAYLMPEAKDVPQLTFWVPLIDVNTDNGCMELARGEHRKNIEFTHIPQDYVEHGNTSWYLEIDPRISVGFNPARCEINRGSLIVFSHLTPHRSLVNASRSCRWSMDFRYLPADAFAGTQQKPIPFRRKDKQLNEIVKQQKAAYMESQLSRDKNIWRHEIKEAKWKDRWVKAVSKVKVS